MYNVSIIVHLRIIWYDNVSIIVLLRILNYDFNMNFLLSKYLENQNISFSIWMLLSFMVFIV